MFDLELSRAIYAERQRQIEQALRRRRLLDSVAIDETSRTSDVSRPDGRDRRTDTSGSPALGSTG
jgi:hypothetical protein